MAVFACLTVFKYLLQHCLNVRTLGQQWITMHCMDHTDV